ncbi:MAG: AAA family ATPase [archaeon]|nr:AAA family ATPase [archaeon]
MVRKLILVAGMPGSGKSVVKEVAEELSIPVLNMGDVIREEVKRRELKEEVKSYGFVMKDVRARLGDQIVAERTVKNLNRIKANVVCIDGVRSLEEVRYFKMFSEVKVLALLSPFKIRLQRLSMRNRPDDSKIGEELEKRDRAELELGLGEVIAMADSYIINDDRPLSEFKERVKAKLTLLM